MNWLMDYKKSLKSLHAEEQVDIYIFRPLAFIIVKLTFRLPLTPNHYSLFSLLSGVMAAFYFLNGHLVQLQKGAFFFTLACVFDCCDGMIARMKKNGSPFGKVVDGVVDYLVNIAVFVALTIGLSKTSHSMAYLFPLAGLAKILHSLLYDFYLTEYINCEQGTFHSIENEIQKTESTINEMTPSKFSLKKLFLTFYLFYCRAQSKMQPARKISDPETYCRLNISHLRQWSWIGPSMHNLVLIVSLVLFEPFYYLVYAIILGNLWMFRMLILQNRNERILSRG